MNGRRFHSSSLTMPFLHSSAQRHRAPPMPANCSTCLSPSSSTLSPCGPRTAYLYSILPSSTGRSMQASQTLHSGCGLPAIMASRSRLGTCLTRSRAFAMSHTPSASLAPMTTRLWSSWTLRSMRKVTAATSKFLSGTLSDWRAATVSGLLFSLPEPSLPKPRHIFAKVDLLSLSANFWARFTCGNKAFASVFPGSSSTTRSRSCMASACSDRSKCALARLNRALMLRRSSFKTALHTLSALVGSPSCKKHAALFSSEVRFSSAALLFCSSENLSVCASISMTFLYFSRASSKRLFLKSLEPTSLRAAAHVIFSWLDMLH
mmetsp:Transcript_59819/g.139353  ORF Transcript_59819/g.139353 Transcript_59819/m.139353 type:complete len:320 (-) Transcript_59819:1144-2103(-)